MKPILQWAVQPDDGRRVRDVLVRMHDLGAPKDGRIYVNGRRAALDDLVEPGDQVEVYPRREAANPDSVSVLAQRDGVLLVHKPAGMPTETTKLGEDSLLSALIGKLSGGEVRAATRLDVQVSGIVICTLGSDAQRRIEKWRRNKQLVRTYIGIGHGSLEADEGVWEWPLGKLRDRAGRHRVAIQGKDPRAASTRFEVIGRAEAAVLLRLSPKTGRMHQLRAHASIAGVPLFGDRLYAGPRQIVAASGAVQALHRIALHATVVETPGIRAESPLPAELKQLWQLCEPRQSPIPPHAD